MTIEYDMPHFCRAVEIGIDPAIDAAEILARYWNDRVPDGENIETITWWLRQGTEQELPAESG